MTKGTFGMASSSFVSTRQLLVLAEETTNTKNCLSLTIDTYMVNLLAGCEESKAAEKFQDAISAFSASACFDIRKKVSGNSRHV